MPSPHKQRNGKLLEASPQHSPCTRPSELPFLQGGAEGAPRVGPCGKIRRGRGTRHGGRGRQPPSAAVLLVNLDGPTYSARSRVWGRAGAEAGTRVRGGGAAEPA
ncbi:unnamed protein product [Rangifer tarandus platyrhynchus]|uniref:Uncharacterized protein n=1 Tax=Rangifer tarandus platyrhynchus TaxID=3082113 RepID=A0ABN8YZK0_RANTA|nr:unnamed protein product [Rangifer tarandus platyrhynchus]